MSNEHEIRQWSSSQSRDPFYLIYDIQTASKLRQIQIRLLRCRLSVPELYGSHCNYGGNPIF